MSPIRDDDGVETVTVGDLVEFLRQWPAHTPVVIGETVTVNEDGVDWNRPKWYAVEIVTRGFLSGIAPILSRGPELH
jgi:hypothetical protein